MTSKLSITTARNHLIFWGITFSILVLFVWVFNAILLPFVLGIAIAYLLNPLVEALGKHKMSRCVASLFILSLFLLFVLGILILTIPILMREIISLAESLPEYIKIMSDKAMPYINWLQHRFGNGDPAAYQDIIQNNMSKILTVGVNVLGGIANGGQAFAGLFTTVVLTPIISFFMMNEWKKMTEWVDHLIPRSRYDIIKNLLKSIDQKLAGFIRGQLSVAFTLAIIYALALTFAGLKFGFLIGLTAGILSIIPLVGSSLGLFVSIIVAWFQAGTWGYVAIIGGIFLIGQFIEGNFLTPKLLGKSVGLHPLWILFSLLAGGSLFGVVGMLLAIPIAAIIGVLSSFALTQYKESPYYKDKNNDSHCTTDTA